jgi:hypothetical protein
MIYDFGFMISDLEMWKIISRASQDHKSEILNHKSTNQFTLGRHAHHSQKG